LILKRCLKITPILNNQKSLLGAPMKQS